MTILFIYDAESALGNRLLNFYGGYGSNQLRLFIREKKVHIRGQHSILTQPFLYINRAVLS